MQCLHHSSSPAYKAKPTYKNQCKPHMVTHRLWCCLETVGCILSASWTVATWPSAGRGGRCFPSSTIASFILPTTGLLPPDVGLSLANARTFCNKAFNLKPSVLHRSTRVLCSLALNSLPPSLRSRHQNESARNGALQKCFLNSGPQWPE